MLAYDSQMVLDSICLPVGANIAPLFIGWSIGQRKAVASVIAGQLGFSPSEIDKQLSELIDGGLLTIDPNVPESYSDPNGKHLGITHQGWLKWSHFSEAYLSDWDFGTLEEWLAWDGIEEPNAGRYSETFTVAPEKKKPQAERRSIFDPSSVSMDEPTDEES